MIFDFGICPVSLEATILKINYPLYTDGPWYVFVFTLSSRIWYNLDYDCLPHPSIRIKRSGQAVIDGKNFWIGSEKSYNDDGICKKNYLIVSFDLLTHQFHVQDMPEQVGVGEFSPPYYISQLGDSLIISGSFGFGAFRIIYAWTLDFEDGIISSCNLLFTILHPAGHFLKLLGFSNANEPIVEAEIVQQWYSSLQVFNPIIEGFVNVHVEANHYIAMPKMAPYEAFACRCGKGDVVLRESMEYNLDIVDSDLHLTPAVRSSNSTNVEPSPYTTNPVTIIPGPSGVVHVSSSTRVEHLLYLNIIRINTRSLQVRVQQARTA
ncbi:hypothetical protein Tco_1082387 [Tanacetum coccineum]|uniref:F-box associated domain-containing protein n=1 Tax=Tanacetum coccineum TaxID=301880 RepID=A0ABQ5I0C9_9ASTR